ncbi:hypothetical protein F0562_015071 [Nyssa sinensis]|uniref:DUF7866 domain-containing protein n=1 Tax=Nyssa sinensis TaxID=561372 RepID=A0A5J4ZK01_9ASTE|nr:hypothetical protein F0562_015071 [Nyssa sinensis]
MNHIAMFHARTVSVLVLLITLFIVTPGSQRVDEQTAIESSVVAVGDGNGDGVGILQPMGPVEYRVVVMEGNTRRKLAPFQLCLSCKCCVAATDPTTCATMPCCFGIDCQLPNKPFGVCAFVPKTCNCTSCAV